MKKSRRSTGNWPPVERFLSDRGYQNSVFWIALALAFFTIPAMLMGGKLLYDIFVVPEGLDFLRDPATNQLVTGRVIEDLAWKVCVIGIIFCVGWTIILVKTRGYPDLELVLVVISALLILAAAGVSAAMTNRCYDLDCDNFKFFAGEGTVIMITILAFVISAGVGKRVGGLSLVFLPVLIYQTILWLPHLLSHVQPDRVIDGVVKAVGLQVTVFIMAVILAVAGGWPKQAGPSGPGGDG